MNKYLKHRFKVGDAVSAVGEGERYRIIRINYDLYCMEVQCLSKKMLDENGKEVFLVCRGNKFQFIAWINSLIAPTMWDFWKKLNV